VKLLAIRGFVSTKPGEVELEELTAALPQAERFALAWPEAPEAEAKGSDDG
jgi:hypothetical protein